jgi:hypothetical protein
MSLKLGKIFLRPSPQFTFRHVSPHEKVNNCLAEQRLKSHRSCQIGRALAPIAPQIVQTMSGFSPICHDFS